MGDVAVKELLKPSDIAPLLGVSPARVCQLLNEGRLPGIRMGRGFRIPLQAWEAWLTEQNNRAKASVNGGS